MIKINTAVKILQGNDFLMLPYAFSETGYSEPFIGTVVENDVEVCAPKPPNELRLHSYNLLEKITDHGGEIDVFNLTKALNSMGTEHNYTAEAIAGSLGLNKNFVPLENKYLYTGRFQPAETPRTGAVIKSLSLGSVGKSNVDDVELIDIAKALFTNWHNFIGGRVFRCVLTVHRVSTVVDKSLLGSPAGVINKCRTIFVARGVSGITVFDVKGNFVVFITDFASDVAKLDGKIAEAYKEDTGRDYVNTWGKDQ
jgi:hypothetical protein